MREYEIMLILPAEADEATVGTAVDRIAKVVATTGGEVGNIDRWGRRRFAYEIDHQHEGYYVVVRFRREPDDTARAGPDAEPGRRGHPVTRSCSCPTRRPRS